LFIKSLGSEDDRIDLQKIAHRNGQSGCSRH